MTAYVLSALLATTAAPSATEAIPAAYVQLAHAYQTADETVLRALLSSDFEYFLVFGPSENLAQYIADWNETKKSSPSLRVDVRITRLAATAASADAEILLTQTSGSPPHAIVDTQRERDRWKLRSGTWTLVSAQTLTDTVAIGDKIVSDDGPFTPLTASQRAAVVAQLKELAWPIETAVPGRGSEDLDPLYDAIGSARIVGMAKEPMEPASPRRDKNGSTAGRYCGRNRQLQCRPVVCPRSVPNVHAVIGRIKNRVVAIPQPSIAGPAHPRRKARPAPAAFGGIRFAFKSDLGKKLKP